MTPERLAWGRSRRVAFVVWTGFVSLLFGLIFTGVTILTIATWLAGNNHDTTPVTDLGFYALGGVMITAGLVAQLRAPERRIAGVQQAMIGILALGVAGLIGDRIEPLIGSIVCLVATAIVAALHPARHEFFRLRRRLSAPLAVLALVAAVPALIYAAIMLTEARAAGPSCFLGRCAYGDRFAELAALALAIVAAGLLAASRPHGWRLTAWRVGMCAVILGAVSIAWPALAGSLGWIGGSLATAWGIAFVVAAERESRIAPPRLQRATTRASPS